MPEKILTSEAVGSAVVDTSLLAWVGKLFSLGSAFLIFRELDPASYGYWRLALAFSALIGGWLTAASTFMAVEAIRGKNHPEQELHSLFAWRGYVKVSMFLAFLALLIGIVYRSAIAAFVGVNDDRLILLASILIVLGIAKSHGLTWVSVQYAFRQQLILQTFESVTYVALLAWFLILHRAGTFGVGLAAVGSSFVGSSIFFIRSLRGFTIHGRSSLRQELGAMWRVIRAHGKWGLASDSLKDLLDGGRLWLLGQFAGPVAVGLYGLADSLLGHVASLINLSTAMQAAFPRLVHEADRLSRAFVRAIRIGTLVEVTLMVMSWGFIPLLVFFLFPRYLPAVPVYYGLSLTLLNVGLTTALNALLPALRLQKEMFISMLVRFLISAALLISLGKVFGVWAVVIETLVSSMAFAFIRLAFVERRTRMAFPGWTAFLATAQDLRDIQDFFLQKWVALKRRTHLV